MYDGTTLEIKSWETAGRLAVTVGTKEILGPGNTWPSPKALVPLALGEPVRLTGAVAGDGPAGHQETKASGTERRLWIRTGKEKGRGGKGSEAGLHP